MAEIVMAKQVGSNVAVYGPRGSFLYSKPGILMGFTSSSVTIKGGNRMFVYGDRGQMLYSK